MKWNEMHFWEAVLWPSPLTKKLGLRSFTHKHSLSEMWGNQDLRGEKILWTKNLHTYVDKLWLWHLTKKLVEDNFLWKSKSDWAKKRVIIVSAWISHRFPRILTFDLQIWLSTIHRHIINEIWAGKANWKENILKTRIIHTYQLQPWPLTYKQGSKLLHTLNLQVVLG